MVSTINISEGDGTLLKKDDSTESIINKLEEKDKELLQILSSMKNEIFQNLKLGKSSVEKDKQEVSKYIREYLEPLSDDEKKHVFDVIMEKGFFDFASDNLDSFGDGVSKEYYYKKLREITRNPFPLRPGVELNLSSNQIGAAGAEAIAKMKLKEGVTLNLSSNQI